MRNLLFAIIAILLPAASFATVPPITGATAICGTTSTTLSDSTSGGTWSSSNSSIATVNPVTGVVTGVTTGTVTISYVATGGTATTSFAVQTYPDAGTISGSSSICVTNYTILTESGSGGNWSSSNTTVAHVNSYGVVTGATVGTATIRYVVNNSCGTDTAAHGVTIISAPYLSAIAGPTTVCASSDIALTDSITGGYWAVSSASIATVTPFTGGATVTGIAAGTVTITYSVANSCAVTSVTKIIHVSPLPVAGSVTGSGNVCTGSNTTLSDSTAGGAWSSSAPSIATVNSAGVVTGVSAGTVAISFTVSNSCGNANALSGLTVNAMPNAGSITGSPTVCAGTTMTLSDASAGGVWTTASGSIATVNAGGIVTGVAAGPTTISYTVTNVCGSAYTTHALTVNPAAVPGTISGASGVCEGSATTLVDITTGGVWSSSNTAIATVSTTGQVFGVLAGSATISYTATNGCGPVAATRVMAVNLMPVTGTVTGSSHVCVGGIITVTDTATGGTWSVSSSAIATVGSTSGVVLGNAAGTVTVSYVVSNACGSLSATLPVTVIAFPTVPALSGLSTVCSGTTTTLTDSVTGGFWSSTATGIASVSTGGILHGISAGSATIYYTVTNSCGSTSVTMPVTVTSTASAGAISGSTTICSGSLLTLTELVSGGTWTSSSPGIASVNTSGVVTGVSAGSATISYSVTNGCGTSVATKSVTISPAPVAGTISGSSSLCAGATSTLGETATGGTWTTSSSIIASVTSTGVVTAISAGSAIISYTVTNSCGTAYATDTITVNPLPAAGTISGATSVCTGTGISLADGSTGGTWTSSAPGIATISTSGVVTGVATGSATISYVVANGCGTATATSAITVNLTPVAGSITGSSSMCAGATNTLTESVSGGVWSTGTSSIATVNTSGIVTGIAAGTSTITYTVTNACGSTHTSVSITVNPLPNAGVITGAGNVCIGSATTLADAATGGTWHSGSTSIATVSAGGVVSGLTAGTAIISYTATNGCGTANATTSMTVNPVAVAGTVTGVSSICQGNSTVFTDGTTGGVWSSSNTVVASVDASGTVTSLGAGTAVISYTVTNACGAVSATSAITVNPLPVVAAISGVTSVMKDLTATLSDATTGGTWSSSDLTIATVDPTGIVSGVGVGSAIISYSVTNGSGCTNLTTLSMEVVPNTTAVGNTIKTTEAVRIFPNPSTGVLNIDGFAQQQGNIEIIISDVTGREVKNRSFDIAANAGTISLNVTDLSNGIYFISVHSNEGNYSSKVIIAR